jgi:hypothetical protein
MAGTFQQQRRAALPCEMMRGCILAEDFLTATRVSDNHGAAVSGSINYTWHGATMLSASNKYIRWTEYIPQPNTFTAVVQFSTSTTLTGGVKAVLTCSAALHSITLPPDGFGVWLESDGLHANHWNGGVDPLPPECSIAGDFFDGETHTVTYVIDGPSGYHTLYIDSEDPSIQATTINQTIGSADYPRAGYSSAVLNGTITRLRWFSQCLTQEEHDLYHSGSLTTYNTGLENGGHGDYHGSDSDVVQYNVHHPQTLTQFMKSPYALYRCNDICDDTVGNKILDATINLRDLHKGDKSTSSTFPVLSTPHTGDGYLFDEVDDYISNVPDLPDEYTITACVSTAVDPFPVVIQSNDTSTLLDDLETSGGFGGYLHSLIIHEGILTQLQLYHDAYRQLYWLWRGRAGHYVVRLINMGASRLAMFPGSISDFYKDFSGSDNDGTGVDVTTNGEDGCSFESSNSHILVEMAGKTLIGDYDECSGTIAILLNIDSTNDAYLVDKGSDYVFNITSGATGVPVNYIGFCGSFCAQEIPQGDDTYLAVVFRDGFEPEFYLNGDFIGLGYYTVNPDDSEDDLIIGNDVTLSNPCPWNIKQVFISDQALAPGEIKALYESAILITQDTGY